MATHPFRIVNVFTQGQDPYTGNPLCVFENGENLSSEDMQALARQFNLSETTFILPSTRANARVRIFTPAYEMAFAGHPTLGTAHVCRALKLGGDSLVLEMQAGLVPVRAAGDRWTLTALGAATRELDVPRATLAAALGLNEPDIGERPLWVKAGKEQLVVPLMSIEAVRRALPEASAMTKIRSEEGLSMAYIFGIGTESRGGEVGGSVETARIPALGRFFFPVGGAILEDPATGSATANFGAWHLAMQRSLPVQLQISQGEYVGRPSTLFLDVNRERQVFVGGDVLEIGRGTITL
ncbi:MAG TPA: PhzF family phenazine biosynthesis protein [Steroidobacteraceae bacterium]|jgi:PhzF family phenazine biosynthesis protein|nr:PhzF family phenazine biosynthesis protein [Steroidobacteraceae bacterium]